MALDGLLEAVDALHAGRKAVVISDDRPCRGCGMEEEEVEGHLSSQGERRGRRSKKDGKEYWHADLPTPKLGAARIARWRSPTPGPAIPDGSEAPGKRQRGAEWVAAMPKALATTCYSPFRDLSRLRLPSNDSLDSGCFSTRHSTAAVQQPRPRSAYPGPSEENPAGFPAANGRGVPDGNPD